VSATEFYLAYRTECAGHAATKELAEWYVEWLLTMALIHEVVNRFIKEAVASGGAAEERAITACQEVLEILEVSRHRALRYAPDDPRYNIHIFKWDEKTQRLVTLARVHGSGITEHNRTWKEGQGHVGTCFESNQMMLLPDLQGPEGQGYRKLEEKLDKTAYRAIMDAPLSLVDQRWGVLAVTSGSPGQFSERELSAIALVSKSLAAICAATKWN
jgi:GAF domain-containing protein